MTAGNAPGLNDGASALVVTSLAFARSNGLTPMARITGYATGGGEPRDLFFAPVIAALRAQAAQAKTPDSEEGIRRFLGSTQLGDLRGCLT